MGRNDYIVNRALFYKSQLARNVFIRRKIIEKGSTE
jgi:hypothetical protein